MTAFIKTLKTVQPRKQLSFQKILAGVKDSSLFRFVLCDIHTPETLKKLFEELTPICKNVEVSREDIGDHMRTYAEKNNILRKPRRMLIGSYLGKEVLINTALAKWNLSHGLEITLIHEFIQFHPERCFLNLAERIANARRKTDVDPSKQILARTQKLTGSSLYSATLLNKERHRNLALQRKSIEILHHTKE